jgi:MoxR-like ATPase
MPDNEDVRAPLSNSTLTRGANYQSDALINQMVNAALHLRRPILVTGSPGSGKSSLIDAVAFELQLGEPLRWAVTSRSTLREGLYTYDAIGRVQGKFGGVGDFIELGPLGTAMLPTRKPRALLIDEIDKADVDLPNDLLNVIEEGRFHIPELCRTRKARRVKVRTYAAQSEVDILNGIVESYEFPFVVMTSNGERDFPPPFLRRCLQMRMPDPVQDPVRLRRIVRAHLGEAILGASEGLIGDFVQRAAQGELLATDQLLNAIQLVMGGYAMTKAERIEMSQRLTAALGKST